MTGMSERTAGGSQALKKTRTCWGRKAGDGLGPGSRCPSDSRLRRCPVPAVTLIRAVRCQLSSAGSYRSLGSWRNS